ncbi:MAG: hypothetical protein CMH26_04235 [Micavibrio sp.]|nr:hypothetical protein [Micavibrio sp.]
MNRRNFMKVFGGAVLGGISGAGLAGTVEYTKDMTNEEKFTLADEAGVSEELVQQIWDETRVERAGELARNFGVAGALIGAACAYKRKPDNTSNNEELNIQP